MLGTQKDPVVLREDCGLVSSLSPGLMLMFVMVLEHKLYRIFSSKLMESFFQGNLIELGKRKKRSLCGFYSARPTLGSSVHLHVEAVEPVLSEDVPAVMWPAGRHRALLPSYRSGTY